MHWYILVHTCYILVCTGTNWVHMHLYLTVSTEKVLILTCKLVHHPHKVGDTGMMQLQAVLLPPRVCLFQGRAFPETGHYANHPPVYPQNMLAHTSMYQVHTSMPVYINYILVHPQYMSVHTCMCQTGTSSVHVSTYMHVPDWNCSTLLWM